MIEEIIAYQIPSTPKSKDMPKKDFGKLIDIIKKMGENAAYTKGFTLGIDDLDILKGKNVYADNDFVAISRNIFEKLEEGKMKMDLATNDASALEIFLENETGYDVYVPDVKNAVLIGGVINEFQGQKIIYFVHRKNNKVICTLEANRTELFKEDRLFLPENHKKSILKSVTWFDLFSILYPPYKKYKLNIIRKLLK